MYIHLNPPVLDTSNHVNLFPLAPVDLNPPVPDTSNQVNLFPLCLYVHLNPPVPDTSNHVNLFPLAPVDLNPPVPDTLNQVTCFPSPAVRAESSTKSAADEPVSPPESSGTGYIRTSNQVNLNSPHFLRSPPLLIRYRIITELCIPFPQVFLFCKLQPPRLLPQFQLFVQFSILRYRQIPTCFIRPR